MMGIVPSNYASLMFTKEEETHASEPWKAPYLPCRYHHGGGTFSGRLERLASLQLSVVPPCTLSWSSLLGDDLAPLIDGPVAALATFSRARRSNDDGCDDPYRLLGFIFPCHPCSWHGS